MSISSRSDLIDYALRKLGAPVIKIDVNQEQLEDRVDEALQFFQDFHFDGTERIYLKHQIVGTEVAVNSVANFIVGELVNAVSGAYFTISSIDAGRNVLITKAVLNNGIPEAQFVDGEMLSGTVSGANAIFVSKTQGDIENRFVPVSDMVTGVVRAIPWWHITNKSTYMFDPQYQIIMSTFQNLASSSMIAYAQFMSHMALVDQVLRPIDSLRFNRKTSKIYLDFDWNTAEIGGFLIFECYRILDPEEFISIYNDRMLKKLVTAKFKYQWASNCQKYQGIQLLGGVTVDATTLMAQAVAEIEAAETEIKDAYQTPSIGFLG